MKSLTEEIMKAAEFDEKFARKLAKRSAPNAFCPINEVCSDIDYYNDTGKADGIQIGSKSEHARLLPLLTALAKANEVMREAIERSVARSDDYGDSHCSQPIRQALTQSEAILKEAVSVK